MNYWLHPEAATDLRDAMQYYRDRAGIGIAQAFLGEFEHAIALLLEHPKLGSIWRPGIRRQVVKHFPYAIIYTVTPGEIRVLAIAHQRRHPNYWKNRRPPA